MNLLALFFVLGLIDGWVIGQALEGVRWVYVWACASVSAITGVL